MNMKISQVLLVFSCFFVFEILSNKEELSPTIKSFSVLSDIKFRYATTRVNTEFYNPHSHAVVAAFYVIIPDNAYISNFSMEINGIVSVGEVKEKEKAKTIYDAAVSRGESAGYVATRHRFTNLFDILVNVQPKAKAVFSLTYQELLQRTFNKYRHVIHLSNRQIIDNFLIEVHVTEIQDVINLNVSPIKHDALETIENNIKSKPVSAVADVEYIGSKEIYIKYNPTAKEQRKFSEDGITGLFEIDYDVDRKNNPNMIYAVDGYFVHFFAPDSSPNLRKHIIFMLDVSGSMQGDKLNQLKRAMIGILDSLKPSVDSFLIGKFSSGVSWMDNVFKSAKKRHIDSAISYIHELKADGGTNINSALLTSLDKLSTIISNDNKNLIFFLTDGQPTAGIQNPTEIKRNIRNANNGTSIFTLGFGENCNIDFLQELAAENGGFARKIYVATDSQQQIQSLYREISNILLKDIKITYLNGAVNENTLSPTSFSSYFKGSEMVVAGTISGNLKSDMNVVYTMNTRSGKKKVTLKLNIVDLDDVLYLGNEDIPSDPKLTTLQSLGKITQNTWVYLNLKEMLGQSRSPEIRKKIISLAVKYGFVTPLTSMVVTQSKILGNVLEDDSLTVRKPKTSAGRSKYNLYANSVVRAKAAQHRSILWLLCSFVLMSFHFNKCLGADIIF